MMGYDPHAPDIALATRSGSSARRPARRRSPRPSRAPLKQRWIKPISYGIAEAPIDQPASPPPVAGVEHAPISECLGRDTDDAP
jgi:hypothetical protein